MKLFASDSDLLLQFRPGESLVEALQAFDGDGALLVEGSGALSGIELEDADGEVRKIGSAEALSLSGVVRDGHADIHGTLLRGAQVLGGRVRTATVVRFVARGRRYQEVASAEHFTGESMEGASDGWGAASERDAQVLPASAPAAAPAAATGGWGAAIAASEQAVEVEKAKPKRKKPAPRAMPSALRGPQSLRRAKDRATMPDFLDEPVPEVGEYVEHKQFGICRVQRVSDDGGLLIKLPRGGTKAIKLTVLEVLPPREDTDRVIYPLVVRKKR